jgi:hypothetical protein
MSGETEPCVCKKCRSISDRLLQFKEDKLTGEWILKVDPKCPECKSLSYELWDWKKKPCPRCTDGKLKIDRKGLVINSD